MTESDRLDRRGDADGDVEPWKGPDDPSARQTDLAAFELEEPGPPAGRGGAATAISSSSPPIRHRCRRPTCVECCDVLIYVYPPLMIGSLLFWCLLLGLGGERGRTGFLAGLIPIVLMIVGGAAMREDLCACLTPGWKRCLAWGGCASALLVAAETTWYVLRLWRELDGAHGEERQQMRAFLLFGPLAYLGVALHGCAFWRYRRLAAVYSAVPRGYDSYRKE